MQTDGNIISPNQSPLFSSKTANFGPLICNISVYYRFYVRVNINDILPSQLLRCII